MKIRADMAVTPVVEREDIQTADLDIQVEDMAVTPAVEKEDIQAVDPAMVAISSHMAKLHHMVSNRMATSSRMASNLTEVNNPTEVSSPMVVNRRTANSHTVSHRMAADMESQQLTSTQGNI